MLDDSELDDVLEALGSYLADSLLPSERDFVKSVGTQWEKRRSLTDKQRAKLGSIFERSQWGGR